MKTHFLNLNFKIKFNDSLDFVLNVLHTKEKQLLF